MLWVLLMAWRDSRGFRRRLLLYTSAIAIGVADLMAIAVPIEAIGHNVFCTGVNVRV